MNQTSKTTFGFWVYLMTDCVLFAALFATYAVLHTNTNGGQSGQDLFSLPYVLVETLLLLTSSFTVGLATIAAQRRKPKEVLAWLSVTFALGLSFLIMEIHEFRHLIHEGNTPQHSGFLSSYFTLVGTHGLHITIGLLWMTVMGVLVLKRGLNDNNTRKLTLLGLFWHFLDIIWIFIFTIVYLLGAARP